MMTIKPVSCESLTPYLLGELSDEEMNDFQKHMRSCDECRDEFESVYSVHDNLLAPASGDEDVPIRTDLKRLTLEKAFSARPPQTGPWYRKIVRTRKFSTLQMTSTAAVVFILGILIGHEYVRTDNQRPSTAPSYMLNQITLQPSNTSLGAHGVVMIYKSGQDDKMVVYVQSLKPLDNPWSCYTLWTSNNHTWRNMGDFTVTSSGAAVIPISKTSDINPNSLTITLEPSWNDRAPKGQTLLSSNSSGL